MIMIIFLPTSQMVFPRTMSDTAWQQLHKNAASNIEQVLEATFHKAAAVRPLTTHHENYPS